MKRFLVPLIISLLFCLDLYMRINEPSQDQQTHNANPNSSPMKSPSSNHNSIIIPLSPPEEGPYKLYGWSLPMYSSFPIQFSSGDTNLSVVARMRSSVTWINSKLYQDLTNRTYDCSELETCQVQGPTRFSDDGQVLNYFDSKQIGGILVKEQIKFAGHTLPGLDVILAPGIIAGNLREDTGSKRIEDVHGVIGLGFKRQNPDVPPLMEYLKAQNLIRSSIFSVQIDNAGGELILGGYDQNRASNGLHFVKLNEEEEGFPEFSAPIKTLGLRMKGKLISSLKKTKRNLDGFNIVLDFEYPRIGIPEWFLYDLAEEESNLNLVEKEQTPESPVQGPFGQAPRDCQLRHALPDLEIGLDGFVIRIPSSVYISESHGYMQNGAEATEKGCFSNFEGLDFNSQTIMLGRPFFEAYYTVFDHENKRMGFSQKYVSDPELFKNSSHIFMAVASFAVLGLYVWFRMRASNKPYLPFSVEGKTLNKFPRVIAESFSFPEDLVKLNGVPVESNIEVSISDQEKS